MSEALKLTPSESVAITASTPDVLEVEASYGPGGKPPPKHWHPEQDEHFRVLEGELRVRTPDGERALGEGETLDVPRETVHQMWNPGDRPARVLWQTKPAGRTERWYRAIDALHRQGRVGRNGMPGPLALAVLLNEYDDVIRFAVGPQPLLRSAAAVLAPLGRLRGY